MFVVLFIALLLVADDSHHALLFSRKGPTVGKSVIPVKMSGC